MTSTDSSPSRMPKPPQFWLRPWTLLLLVLVLASSVAVFGAWGIGVFAIVVGLTIYIHGAGYWQPFVKLLMVVLCLAGLVALLMPAQNTPREVSRRATCKNNLRQLGLSLLLYYEKNHRFPPAYIADKNGKPMHSWRVLILPYLDEDALYKSYDFNEPWDGPNNKKLLTQRPTIYACPGDDGFRTEGPSETSYVAVVGPNAAWPGEKPRKAGRDFADGESNTIMLVEVADSDIAWTEPRDLSLETLSAAKDGSPSLSVSSKHGRRESFFFIYDRCYGANAAFADGSVRYLPPDSLSPENLRKILQVGGCTDEELQAEAMSGNESRHLNWPNIAALAVWLLSVGALWTYATLRRAPSEEDAD